MISVVIPVYNSAKFINQAVESTLIQPEVGEVLLVEDGSQDNSLEICLEAERMNDQVRVLQHEGGVNRGVSTTRNVGILNARFPYVAFLDCDDYYLSGRFIKSLKILNDRPDVDAVYEKVRAIFDDAESEQLWREGGQGQYVNVKPGIPPGEIFEFLFRQGKSEGWNAISGIIVRKKFLIEVGMFLDDLKNLEWSHLSWRMAAVGKWVEGEMDRPIAVYRRHSQNCWAPWGLSDSNEEINDYQLQKLTHLHHWMHQRGLTTYYKLPVIRQLIQYSMVDCRLHPNLPLNLDQLFRLAKLAMKYPEALLLNLFWRKLARQFVPQGLLRLLKNKSAIISV